MVGSGPATGGGRRWLCAAAAVGVLAGTSGCGVWGLRPGRPTEGVGGPAYAVAAPRADREAAVFDVVDGVDRVAVRVADIGADLYRVATPEGGPRAPRVAAAGDRFTLTLADTRRAGESRLDVRLSHRVRWTVRLAGGAKDQVVDLGAGTVRGVEILGGTSRTEVVLPKPAGAVPVRLGAGAGEFLVRAPAGVPVRVRLGAGAGSATIDAQRHGGQSAGATFAPAGWATATDRYDVDVAGGVGSFTLDRT
ncbi:MAG TPA: hypothetical protein VES42_00045 [Pilimelia sp.]|nr:hypothetical protein [Pilimelia sp.]